MAELYLVETSLATLEQARTLARQMVVEQVVACCHIIPCESIYRWDGAVHEEQEVMLRCTTADHAATIAYLVRRHPYQEPAIIAYPIMESTPGYIDWVKRMSHAS